MDHDLQTARAFSDQQICRQQLAVSVLIERLKQIMSATYFAKDYEAALLADIAKVEESFEP